MNAITTVSACLLARVGARLGLRPEISDVASIAKTTFQFLEIDQNCRRTRTLLFAFETGPDVSKCRNVLIA